MSKREYCHTISQQYNCPRCLLIDLEKASNEIKELEAKLSLAIAQRNKYHAVAEMEGMTNFTVEEMDMQLEKLRGPNE